MNPQLVVDNKAQQNRQRKIEERNKMRSGGMRIGGRGPLGPGGMGMGGGHSDGVWAMKVLHLLQLYLRLFKMGDFLVLIVSLVQKSNLFINNFTQIKTIVDDIAAFLRILMRQFLS